MRRRACVLAALAAGLLTSCGRDTGTATNATPIRLALDLWAGYYPALIADGRGHLREAGIKLSTVMPGDTDRMISEFAGGQHDLICCSLGDLINLTRGRLDAKVILVTDESAGADVIFVRRGATLGKGKLRVATNLGGFGEVFVLEYLRRQGVGADRVAWVNADASSVPTLLAQGQVDVAHTWEPYASAVSPMAAERVFSSADTPGLVPDVLATSSAFIDRARPALRAFVDAWLQAQQWWLANPAEGQALLKPRLPPDPGPLAPQGMRLIGRDENRRLLGASGQPAGLAPVVQRYSDFFLARGHLSRPVDPASLLYGDLLS